ncbi:MAG TPA: virulence RhuM family protein [Pyrinomonadaceae bacterium]|nr:virulence RhuM family protein [Pyrinomonadaceae bacterium]
MNNTELIIYQTEDGRTRIEARLEDETVWLTLDQMSELFQKSRSTINEHILNIYQDGELSEAVSLRKIGISDFSTKPTNFYNLDIIISVGYRVKSIQGTRFRQWATQRLREYIVKGFTLNDDRLKESGDGSYFDELLERIRDIRSSEKVFWRKVLDIYATSVDYDPRSSTSAEFFKSVQNKMHWAAHGNTAAEVIYKRIDAQKPNLGLTNFNGKKPTKQETEIAKNYLNETELNILNRIVTAYLEFAELQAMNRKAMYMKDWGTKLDDFLRMAGNEVLDHSGTISHETMLKKATAEYEKFREARKNDLSEGEKDFIKHLESAERKLKPRLAKPQKKTPK